MRHATLACCLLVTVVVASIGHAQTNWRTYRDADVQFRILYPPNWMLGTPRGPNVRVTLFPPSDVPRANCNIVVKEVPETRSLSETSLNSEVASMDLTAHDWSQMMGTKWPDFRLIESRRVKVDNQPALLGVEEHSHQTVDRKTYFKGSMLAVFTPGQMFLISCAGKGDTQTEARDSFAHWEQTFQRMQGSLVFESRFNVGDPPAKPPTRTVNADADAPTGFGGATWLMSKAQVRAAFPDAVEFGGPDTLSVQTTAFSRSAVVGFMFKSNLLLQVAITFTGNKTRETYQQTHKLVEQEYGRLSPPTSSGQFTLASEKRYDRVMVQHLLYTHDGMPIEQVILYRTKAETSE